MSDINYTEEIPEIAFPINSKLIKTFQLTEPSLMAKYKDGKYNTGSFRGGSNIGIILIMC